MGNRKDLQAIKPHFINPERFSSRKGRQEGLEIELAHPASFGKLPLN